jgi:hypothetical protein
MEPLGPHPLVLCGPGGPIETDPWPVGPAVHLGPPGELVIECPDEQIRPHHEAGSVDEEGARLGDRRKATRAEPMPGGEIRLTAP